MHFPAAFVLYSEHLSRRRQEGGDERRGEDIRMLSRSPPVSKKR